jgi:endonuclease/exonuclease/phosphatase family metal-dependent hydrolase
MLNKLKPYAHRVAAVTETPGKLTIKSYPSQYPAYECREITVISANLWHDWPRYRRLSERLSAFAQLVEEERADILLLQEVARTPDIWVDDWLANRLGMAYVYSRANGHNAIGFEEGLAIFSRYPLDQPQLSQLGKAGDPFVRRLVLGANVDTPCGSLLAFSVHLGLQRRENARQQDQLRQFVNRLAINQPALVGGDFNSHESASQIGRTKKAWVDTFRHLHPHAEGHTHILRWPWGGILKRHRLDYIFLNSVHPKWRIAEARHLTTPGESHSDHNAVLARLEPLN